jgi:V-type H+-transporting ATPase subunit a
MSVLFGYMSCLIIVKWLTPWKNTAEAPSIIAFMINMFLKSGEVEGAPLIGDVETNEWINRVFLVIALTCIPLMLLVKPIYIKFTEDHGHSVRDMKLLPLSKKQGYSRFEDEDEEP